MVNKESLFGFVFLFLVIVDLEVAQFIGILCGSHNSQPITKIVLLQVLFSQILQVSLAEGQSRGKDDLVLLTTKSKILAKVVGFTPNLQKEKKGSSAMYLITIKNYVIECFES